MGCAPATPACSGGRGTCLYGGGVDDEVTSQLSRRGGSGLVRGQSKENLRVEVRAASAFAGVDSSSHIQEHYFGEQKFQVLGTPSAPPIAGDGEEGIFDTVAETKGGLERTGISSVADILAQDVHEPPTRSNVQEDGVQVDIWQERRVFGSRAGGIKDVMLGTAPLPVLDMTKKRSHSSGIKIVKRDSRSVKLRLGVGGTAERIVSALHTVISEQTDEDTDLEKCNTSMRHVGKIEKHVDSAISKAEDPRREALCKELKDEEANMKKCTGKLKVVEANRAAVVSELKEALQEQESELEKVRTQLQLAEAMVEAAANMQRRLKNEPVIPSSKPASSVEPGKPLSNGQVKDQQKTAAAILADKIAASSNSQQILQSALSKFAAEEAKNSSEARPDKRLKVEQSSQVPSVVNAAAFVPKPAMAATTAQQPQTILVQQTPIQTQAPAPQPQYNVYQAPPQQFVQQPGGVMMGMPYNMNTMTPPPPPQPPQMMNLTRPSPSTPQPPMGVMPQAQPPPPTPPILQQQLQMNIAPPMQFTLQQPGAPPFRPLQPPPGMQFFHPHSQ